MRIPAGLRTRLFLVCWLGFSLHFSTNVVREHYPAFTLIDQGNFQLDEYLGFHADIFEHDDGHAYIGNQVAGSLPAVPALLIFDPLLDRLEEYSKRKITESTTPIATHYDTEYPNRGGFMKLVKERGLDLRFGAATVITSVFCMAPLAAWLVLMVFGVLRRRGVSEARAVTLAFLFAFATPVLYRASHLNHNLFLTMVIFGSFLAVWAREDAPGPLPMKRRLLGGFLAGWGLALDYAGVVPLLLIYGYLIATRWRPAGGKAAILESIPFVLGAVPPVVFLCWTQWWMYGDPFLPGQFHMPDQNIYVGHGMRGFGLPDLEVFYENLMSPDYGLVYFAPILLLAFVPALYRRRPLVLPGREALFVVVFTLAFLVFCASNSYSRLQFNTGFRYLLPLVPFLFLAAADHLGRMPRWLLFLVGLPCLLHGWVLAMVRFTRPRLEDTIDASPESWRRVLEDGLALPWLTVLRQTSADPSHFIHWQIWPFALFLLTGLVALWIWRCGRRPLQELPTSMHRAVLPTDSVDQ